MKYETLIEDYHGHMFRNRFEAKSDEEALKIANNDGYNYFSSDDCIWRVEGEYVNNSCFNEAEQLKMKQNYTRIYKEK